jgi:hypothetical protein
MGIMKTTIEIADAILEDARAVAEEQGTTLRQLVEEGLRRVTEERNRKKAFRLRRASFRGKGLRDGQASWEDIRDLVYKGRGA